ncbi:MAG: acyltransferase [Candidatus Bathyarchaeia archaeon]|jgi:acetyltransferase-like isoleucine patch superfamily enzyme
MVKVLSLISAFLQRICMSNSHLYISFLRKKGVTIGEGTAFFGLVRIDCTRPYLVEIGKNCVLTDGVILLTHGYDLSVLREVFGEMFCSSGKVVLEGNNFIGVNSVILKGVKIGKNSIIGACSVVTHDIPSNCVAAGNPCKVIMTLEEYYEKRKVLHVKEAKAYALEIYRKTNRIPKIADFLLEEFPIFQRTSYSNGEPIYKSFQDFLLDAGVPINNHKVEN